MGDRAAAKRRSRPGTRLSARAAPPKIPRPGRGPDGSAIVQRMNTASASPVAGAGPAWSGRRRPADSQPAAHAARWRCTTGKPRTLIRHSKRALPSSGEVGRPIGVARCMVDNVSNTHTSPTS